MCLVAGLTIITQSQFYREPSPKINDEYIIKTGDQMHSDITPPHTFPLIAGGSATGNAIKPLQAAGTQTEPLSNQLASHKKNSAKPFEHLFKQRSFQTDYLYKSAAPQDFDLKIESDAMTSEQLLSQVMSLRQQYPKKQLKIGSEVTGGFKLQGSLVLRNLSNLTFYGLQINEINKPALEIRNSDRITIISSQFSSLNHSAVRVDSSKMILFKELFIHDSQTALEIMNQDYSTENTHFLSLSRSVLNNNQVGIKITSAYGINLSNNFISHHEVGISVHQEESTLIHLPSAISGHKNIFYKSHLALDSNLSSEFLSSNLMGKIYDFSKVKKLAWFWLAHSE